MKTNENGFAIVGGLLIALAISMVGGTGYYVYSSQKATRQSLENASAANAQVQPAEKKQEVQNNPVQPVENKNPGYVIIKEWGIAARIGSTANSDKLTYRIDKDDYGDDTAYFMLKESVSKNCREVGVALHRKLSGDNSKYAKIGNAFYAPTAAPTSICDKSVNEDAAIKLLEELTTSVNNLDYEFKLSD